ncbi:MAG: CCA tRNA nucleotidyltransferase [Nitrospinae bacterium]|nr:CCA tRNA nucleotidyltransferase [Nitrospinota bacterium]
MLNIKPPDAAIRIIQTLEASGHRALLAGGCVRDALLGVQPKDWDIATDAAPEAVQGRFEKTVAVGAQFGVVRVRVGDQEFEVAQFREDGPYSDGRHPDAVRSSDEKGDANRRDFTINGMFYDVSNHELLDYVGGRRDLDAGVIRAIGEPGLRFGEDHLRMMRAVRFSARFGFSLDPATAAAIEANAGRIGKISPERIRDELTTILTRENADAAFAMLDSSGLLEHVLPEVAAMRGVAQPPEFHPEGDVWTHVLAMLRIERSASPTLAWGILLHDAGKPATYAVTDRIRFNGHDKVGAQMSADICERLRMPRAQASRIHELVANHMRFMHVEKMREARLKRFLREPYFEELLELHRIDCLASHGNLRTHEFCARKLGELHEEALRPLRLLDGHGLMAMGYPPGPGLGEILAAIEDEQLEGRISTREEAREFARRNFPVPENG